MKGFSAREKFLSVTKMGRFSSGFDFEAIDTVPRWAMSSFPNHKRTKMWSIMRYHSAGSWKRVSDVPMDVPLSRFQEEVSENLPSKSQRLFIAVIVCWFARYTVNKWYCTVRWPYRNCFDFLSQWIALDPAFERFLISYKTCRCEVYKSRLFQPEA